MLIFATAKYKTYTEWVYQSSNEACTKKDQEIFLKIGDYNAGWFQVSRLILITADCL
jgi:hypothetical protein